MLFSQKLRNASVVIKVAAKHMSTDLQCQEVRIPVAWGHIAGKWWGPQDKRPILVLHGWQDNCGSFDRLIPLLPRHVGYLAIDFSGHGLSSQLPQGMFYHNINAVLMIRQLMDYLQWKRISFMGHSLGGITSYVTATMFPEMVDFAICIDGLHPLINPKGTQRFVETVNEFLKYDQLNTLSQNGTEEPPAYTLDDMKMKLHLGTRKSINLECTEYILKRNISPSKTHLGKYYFNRDPRLKAGPLTSTHVDELVANAKRATFPLFASKFDKSPFFSNEAYFMTIIEHLQTASKDFQMHQLPGRHHEHLNNPVVLTEVVSDFILKHDIDDRSVGGIKPEMVCK